MMKNRDSRKLSLPLSSNNLPATVSGINRNSPSRSSIKIVPPPVIPNRAQNAANLCSEPNSAPAAHKVQVSSRHLSSFDQPYYDANNYYNIKPSMQQIPEQTIISMFVEDSTANDVERISPGSLSDQLKYNRYSSASLDSGRGSDSVKLTSGQSNRVSVHSCESIGSSSSTKDSDASQQSSSLSSSSSTSSSFCSSSSASASSSSSSSYPNQYSNRTLSSSSSIVSNNYPTTPVGDFTVHVNSGSNVFSGTKATTYANLIHNSSPRVVLSEMSGNFQNLVAQAGPPSIAEMILHGISDPEIIHNWLQKIHMGKYEGNFIESAYDMSTIARMTPQDLTAIGITDPKARSVLTSEIQKLNFPEGIPSFKPDTLEEWLNLLNLQCYYLPLCKQGYPTIDRVTELDLEDFEDVGIFKLGHQKKLILAIKKVKTLKSKQQSAVSSETEDIYSTGPMNCRNVPPSNLCPEMPQYPVMPTIMPSHYPTATSSGPTHALSAPPLPYQDVSIKMYASIKQNSPTQPELPSFEACSIITPNNIVPSSLLFNTKPQMRTFQQMSEMNIIPNGSPGPTMSASLPYGAPPSAPQFVNAPLSARGRGRSLESLDHPEMHFYSNYQYQNANYSNMGPYKAPYQFSNGDLSSINRPTADYEGNPSLMNTFNMNGLNQFSNVNYEIDGTATLHRPKNLIKSKPVAKIVASSRQSDLYDCYDTASIQSFESHDKLSIKSDSSSETSLTYSGVKKPPPPPPKRVNSIKKPNSVPSTPLHQPSPPLVAPPEQVYSNLMYLNSHFYKDPLNNSLDNENVFASCVKSLTSKFSEMHSLTSTDDDFGNQGNGKQLNSPAATHSSHTLPLNKKELSFIENNCLDTVNVSSSSSTESMPFANDNVGTIRQKSSHFLQNALRLSDAKLSSSSSSSSSSTSSPMFAKNLSLPNSTLNSPLATAASNFHSNAFSNQQNDFHQQQNSTNSNDSRQNVVDSLEDIEIMLANLKTQLDAIH